MRQHRTLLATILVVAAVLTPVIVYYANYYETSYNSVNGTTVSIVSVKRYITSTATFPNVTFYLDVNVATRGPLDTFVHIPVFQLTAGADSWAASLGSGVVGDSAIITPTRSAIFILTFRATDETSAYRIAGSNPNFLYLSLYSVENAGMYQEVVTKTDSGNWTFSGTQGTRGP